MPVIDMPLEKLLTYKGTNECPPDFEEYWDSSIAEMKALGTAYTLIEENMGIPQVKCYNMFFTGVGGSKIHCRLAVPAKIDKPIPAVCIYHGYSSHCGSFFSLIGWAAAGFAAVAMSCRGQGGLSEDLTCVRGTTFRGHIVRGLNDPDPKNLYYRRVFLDAAQLAGIMMSMDEVDAGRVGATGVSQGGGLALACAALTPELNRVAPMISFLSDYRRVWDMDMDINAYAELREFFRNFDPEHKHEKEIFTKLGYIDNHNLAHRIKAKVLMFTGLIDNVCPPSTQFAVYNNITSSKDIVLYPDYGHEVVIGSDDKCLEFFLGM